MDVLITSPITDEATQIVNSYARDVVEYAHGKKLSVAFLENLAATPSGIGYWLRMGPRAFFNFSHGDYRTLYGEEEDKPAPAVTPKNAELLKGTIADVTSCQSARDLGPVAIDEGCDAYLGYSEVCFVEDDSGWRRILNTSKKRLLDRRTVEESYEDQVHEMEKYVGETGCPLRKICFKLFGLRGNVLAREFMCWNLTHYVVVEGSDLNAKI